MMPSHINDDKIKETDEHLGIIEKLTAAFRSQSNIGVDKEQHKQLKTSRSNRQLNSSNTITPPFLRKRSSGSISSYRATPSQQQQESNESRRRDSNGINYNNFVSALNEYQNNNNKDEPPLFTVKREEPTTPTTTSSPLLPPSPKTTNTANNKGRVAKRLSATLNTMTNPIHSNPHGSNNNLNKTIKETKSIESTQLATLLDNEMEPLLIDMRQLEDYEKSHIKNSINVNLPSLLIKRYRRGVVSNFNLETFITTPEGVDYFQRWMNKFNISDNNIQNLPEGAKFIIYDDHMMNEDTTTAVWTLMGVIAKNLSISSNVKWLKDGFSSFEQWDIQANYLSGAQYQKLDTPPLPIPKNSMLLKSTSSSMLRNNTIKLKMPTPMISRSATTLSSKSRNINTNPNVQRRASLFSLDTSTLRSKNTPQQRRLVDDNSNSSELSSIHEKSTLFSPTTPLTTTSTNTTSTSPDVFHTPLEQMPTTAAGELTPKIDGEFDFVISEIIPHFLYLGPEIANIDQLGGLQSRSIKRILNMAEECDDDVPGLKETFKYQKIAARDTVDMQNVQGTLIKAVQVIDDSKKHHEPIYVHCKAGKSRSAAAILAYLVLSEHWTLKKAYRHIVKARPNISPNIGFVAELMKLEEGVHGEVSNFAGIDWHLIDLSHPPSPDTQKEMGRLEKAWKRGRSQSGSNNRLRSTSTSSRKNLSFSANEDTT